MSLHSILALMGSPAVDNTTSIVKSLPPLIGTAHSRSNALSGLSSAVEATWNFVSAKDQSSEGHAAPPPRFRRCDLSHSLARKCFKDASRKARNRPRSARKPVR